MSSDEIALLQQAGEHIQHAIDCMQTRNQLTKQRTGNVPVLNFVIGDLSRIQLRISNEIDRLQRLVP